MKTRAVQLKLSLWSDKGPRTGSGDLLNTVICLRPLGAGYLLGCEQVVVITPVSIDPKSTAILVVVARYFHKCRYVRNK